MINFIREHSYTIVKMIINQIGLTFFGLVLAFATSTNETLLLVTSIFSICFYLFLLYTMTWEVGAKEKIRIDSGRATKKPFTGLLIALCANLINLLMGIILCVTKLFIAEGDMSSIAFKINQIINAAARFLEAMYLGVIVLFSPYNPIIFLLIPLPSIAVCGLAYWAGLHDFKVTSFLGINTKTKK